MAWPHFAPAVYFCLLHNNPILDHRDGSYGYQNYTSERRVMQFIGSNQTRCSVLHLACVDSSLDSRYGVIQQKLAFRGAEAADAPAFKQSDNVKLLTVFGCIRNDCVHHVVRS